MSRKILLTGATDGIGFETAKLFAQKGHNLLLHGRNPTKLQAVQEEILKIAPSGIVETYMADLSSLDQVVSMADNVTSRHDHIDVLINNAGIFKTDTPITDSGIDIRFMVNTIAPYLLTKKLLPLIPKEGRIINLSSAAQAPVNIEAVRGNIRLSDSEAYAQSKLAIIMWSTALVETLKHNGPMIACVNPASFLGSKMVKEAYGMAGNDLSIGADILYRAAISNEFSDASGEYFDNDSGQFTSPHPAASDMETRKALMDFLDRVISQFTSPTKPINKNGMAISHHAVFTRKSMNS